MRYLAPYPEYQPPPFSRRVIAWWSQVAYGLALVWAGLAEISGYYLLFGTSPDRIVQGAKGGIRQLPEGLRRMVWYGLGCNLWFRPMQPDPEFGEFGEPVRLPLRIALWNGLGFSVLVGVPLRWCATMTRRGLLRGIRRMVRVTWDSLGGETLFVKPFLWVRYEAADAWSRLPWKLKMLFWYGLGFNHIARNTTVKNLYAFVLDLARVPAIVEVLFWYGLGVNHIVNTQFSQLFYRVFLDVSEVVTTIHVLLWYGLGLNHLVGILAANLFHKSMGELVRFTTPLHLMIWSGLGIDQLLRTSLFQAIRRQVEVLLAFQQDYEEPGG